MIFPRATSRGPRMQKACRLLARISRRMRRTGPLALKETGKVICFVRQNGIEAGQEMDIGHIVNRAYAGQGYEEEALCALYRRVFSEMGVKAILARWAAADEEKLAPLKALGLRCVSVHMGDYFQPNAKGLTGQFAGATYRITKEEFAQRYGLRK